MQTTIKLLFTTLIYLLPSLLFAQYKAVTFDYEKAVFGENQPLPAESHIMLQGKVQDNIGIIEVDVFEPKGRDKRPPLYTNRWKRSQNSDKHTFLLPINFRLKGSSTYDFQFKYYQPIATAEMLKVRETLIENINTYLQQVILLHKNKISLEQNIKQIVRSLNQIVTKGLSLYRNRTNTNFEGFSDLITNKLKQLSSVRLAKGKLVFRDSDKKDAKAQYRQKLIEELETMLASELEQYFYLKWYKLFDSKYIDNYSTEKSKRTVAIQAGFGGAYLEGNANRVSFGASPFVGLAFPLSKRSFKSKFLSNTSITLGVFLLDFQGANNTKISGPIFKRPTYVGVSYKLFRFIHINAGATFLEDASTAGQINGIGNRVFVRPFLGVSAQVDLWMDFSK